jgi:hypothetical protein
MANKEQFDKKLLYNEEEQCRRSEILVANGATAQ